MSDRVHIKFGELLKGLNSTSKFILLHNSLNEVKTYEAPTKEALRTEEVPACCVFKVVSVLLALFTILIVGLQNTQKSQLKE